MLGIQQEKRALLELQRFECIAVLDRCISKHAFAPFDQLELLCSQPTRLANQILTSDPGTKKARRRIEVPFPASRWLIISGQLLDSPYASQRLEAVSAAPAAPVVVIPTGIAIAPASATLLTWT